MTHERIGTYEKLKPFIEGSVVGELADDSANVVDLVKENYEVRTWLMSFISSLDNRTKLNPL